MTATDSVKKLARLHCMARPEIREIGRDLGLRFDYSPTRRTWFLDEAWAIVSTFNEHLADLRGLEN